MNPVQEIPNILQFMGNPHPDVAQNQNVVNPIIPGDNSNIILNNKNNIFYIYRKTSSLKARSRWKKF